MITSPAVIRAARWLMRVVPVPVVRAAASGAGTLSYFFMKERRATAIESMAYLDPDSSPARRRRMARHLFRNMAAASIDLFRLPDSTAAYLQRLVEVEGLAHLDSALSAGKGVIIVSPHMGPYELGASYLAVHGYRVHAMVEKLAPDVMEAMASFRQATGMKLVEMGKAGMAATLRLLAAGEILLLAADRVIGDVKGTVVVPFAAGARKLPSGPAMFSLRMGSPIVIAHIARTARAWPRYRLVFSPPLYPTGEGDEGRLALMQRIGAQMSAVVREHPEEWYVFQPEWLPATSAAGGTT